MDTDGNRLILTTDTIQKGQRHGNAEQEAAESQAAHRDHDPSQNRIQHRDHPAKPVDAIACADLSTSRLCICSAAPLLNSRSASGAFSRLAESSQRLEDGDRRNGIKAPEPELH